MTAGRRRCERGGSTTTAFQLRLRGKRSRLQDSDYRLAEVPDKPHHGGPSDHPTGSYSAWRAHYTSEVRAEEIRTVIAATQLGERPFIVGHSFGGLMTMKLRPNLPVVLFRDGAGGPVPPDGRSAGLAPQRMPR
jgi:pimeloyl-ACP methyl ester carboxylesterase